jgi:hypothetical protein
LPDSVPPGKTYELEIVVNPSLRAGQYIDLSIKYTGNGNGTATISPSRIVATTKVTVTGGIQTDPGRGGKLKIQAKLSGSSIKAESQGFSVCAHPTNFSTRRVKDLNESINIPNLGEHEFVGVVAINDWESDSGNKQDLKYAKQCEVVAVADKSQPSPFDIDMSVTSRCFNAAGDAHPDAHGHSRAGITKGPEGWFTYGQLFVVKCKRCGVADVPCGNSGFAIVHILKKEDSKWVHRCRKIGSRIKIGKLVSDAGSGTADSDSHVIFEQ